MALVLLVGGLVTVTVTTYLTPMDGQRTEEGSAVSSKIDAADRDSLAIWANSPTKAWLNGDQTLVRYEGFHESKTFTLNAQFHRSFSHYYYELHWDPREFWAEIAPFAEYPARAITGGQGWLAIAIDNASNEIEIAEVASLSLDERQTIEEGPARISSGTVAQKTMQPAQHLVLRPLELFVLHESGYPIFRADVTELATAEIEIRDPMVSAWLEGPETLVTAANGAGSWEFTLKAVVNRKQGWPSWAYELRWDESILTLQVIPDSNHPAINVSARAGYLCVTIEEPAARAAGNLTLARVKLGILGPVLESNQTTVRGGSEWKGEYANWDVPQQIYVRPLQLRIEKP